MQPIAGIIGNPKACLSLLASPLQFRLATLNTNLALDFTIVDNHNDDNDNDDDDNDDDDDYHHLEQVTMIMTTMTAHISHQKTPFSPAFLAATMIGIV